MEILFGDKRLEKWANDYRLCKRKWERAEQKYLTRDLTTLGVPETLEDARNLPGRYHELKEDRKGQWACDFQIMPTD